MRHGKLVQENIVLCKAFQRRKVLICPDADTPHGTGPLDADRAITWRSGFFRTAREWCKQAGNLAL